MVTKENENEHMKEIYRCMYYNVWCYAKI